MNSEEKEAIRLQAFVDQYHKEIGEKKKEFDKDVAEFGNLISDNPDKSKVMMCVIEAINNISKLPRKQKFEIFMDLIQTFPAALDDEILFHITLGIVAGVMEYCEEIPPELKRILRIQ